MPRHRSDKAQVLPQALVRLIHAAQKSKRDSEGSDITGAAEALRQLGELALWTLPIRGVFVPNNNDVAAAVTKIANEHLGLKDARREFTDTLARGQRIRETRSDRIGNQSHSHRF